MRKDIAQRMVPSTLKKENMLKMSTETRSWVLQWEAPSFLPLPGEQYVLMSFCKREFCIEQKA